MDFLLELLKTKLVPELPTHRKKLRRRLSLKKRDRMTAQSLQRPLWMKMREKLPKRKSSERLKSRI
jgi:hypothetical protein